MRKRLLSGILAFAMILTTFLSNVTVIAAAGENEAKIGDTEYATLTDAISAATDGDYVDTCTVSFVADGVVVDTLTVDAGTVLTDADYPAVPEKDGCTGEWNKVTDPITEDTTIEAVYTINTYTVTFEAEGETVDTIVVDWGTVLTDEDYPEVPAKEGYTGKWIIPADGITGDTTIVPEYTKVAPPVDTGDYAPIALPVALAGIAALVFCMKKREEDAE